MKKLVVSLLLIAAASFCQSTSLNSCWVGPNYWCVNETTENACRFLTQNVGVCGYSSKKCPIETGNEFCQSSSALNFNGGLTGAYEDFFYYYLLSLYWPPSSCPPVYNPKTEFREYFCSPYTNQGQPGSERLVLHGLWPTFSTSGNYQGWSQFCMAEKFDWSQCHIDGNLCPWANASESYFSQSDYEYCLSVENVKQCLINGTEILQPVTDRLKVLAPGYLNDRNLFINHEWTKHGSCCASAFNNNVSDYLNQMLNFVELVTQPGSLTDQFIQKNVGKQIGLKELIDSLNRTAIINCNEKCQLEEVWMCVSRNVSTGLPNGLIRCPEGAQYASDSCRQHRCDAVSIPARNKRPSANTNIKADFSTKVTMILLEILLILIILKLIFIKFSKKFQNEK